MTSRGLIVLLFCTGYFGLYGTAVASKRNWNVSQETLVTRCFKSEKIKVRCIDGSYSENGKRIFSQELEIEASDYNGAQYSYGYGKMLDGELCRGHHRKIQRLLRGVDQACITGDGETVLSDVGGRNETNSRWSKLETRRGYINW